MLGGLLEMSEESSSMRATSARDNGSPPLMVAPDSFHTFRCLTRRVSQSNSVGPNFLNRSLPKMRVVPVLVI